MTGIYEHKQWRYTLKGKWVRDAFYTLGRSEPLEARWVVLARPERVVSFRWLPPWY